MLTALIMAGGKGERFWPKSRSHHPKQLQKIFSDESMIEETINRLAPLIDKQHIFISTGSNLEKVMKEMLPDIPSENFIIEPIGRNTAPCIGLSALVIKEKLGNVPIAVLPSDHMIKDRQLFHQTLESGADIAQNEHKIVTIGIQPTFANTGYGYIQHGDHLGQVKSIDYYQLSGFTEKPDEITAKRFIEAKTYLWNSGMFIWTCNTILEEINQHLPELGQLLKQIEPSLKTQDRDRTIQKLFPNAESISIDFGVMEKTSRGVVLRGTFDWSDVGSWLALEKIIPADENNNSVKGLLQAIDTQNCVVVSDKQLIATIGVKDLVVVATDDAVLICHKDNCESIKNIVEMLKSDTSYSSYL